MFIYTDDLIHDFGFLRLLEGKMFDTQPDEGCLLKSLSLLIYLICDCVLFLIT